MALSKTWYTSNNLAIADSTTANRCAHSSIWGLGAMLLGYQSGTDGPEGARPSGAYWTLVGSSDSATAGIDSTDRLSFSGAFSDADWVRAAAASPHTWFVLRSPAGLLDGPWYLCFDYIGPTNDQTASFIISKNVFSGGSTSARPTSTGESVASSQVFSSASSGAAKIHLQTDANGGFRFQRSRNGTGYFDFFLSVEPLVEYHTGDASRTFLSCHYLDSGRGAWTMQASPQMRGMCSDGTTAITSTNVAFAELTFRPGGLLMTSYTTTNALDSTVDALPCVYVYDNTTGLRGIRGRFPDMWIVGNQVVVGSTFPGSGNPERMLVGNYMSVGSVAPSL